MKSPQSAEALGRFHFCHPAPSPRGRWFLPSGRQEFQGDSRIGGTFLGVFQRHFVRNLMVRREKAVDRLFDRVFTVLLQAAGSAGRGSSVRQLRERAVVARSQPIKLHLKPEVIFCFHFYDIKSLFKASGAVCHRFLKFARLF